MPRSRYVVAAVVFAGSGLVAGVVSAQNSDVPEQQTDEIAVDQNGHEFPAPRGQEIKDGRIPVVGPHGRVGWADGYDVMGPPPGDYTDDELAPMPIGEIPVYADSTGFKRVGTLTPSGFVPLGEEIPESPATTVLEKPSSDASDAR